MRRERGPLVRKGIGMSSERPKERPNVVLITADQFRGDVMACAGNEYIQTPHMDQLAHSGVRFSGAFSECPVSVPARRCLMSGLNPYSHGLHTNRNVPFENRPFLAEVFGRSGYQTQAVGKMHVSPQRMRVGFDHVLLNEEGRREDKLRLDDYAMYLQERGLLHRAWAHGMPANGLQSRPHTLPEEHMMDAWTARESCRFLERRDPTAPFFLYVSFRNPHPPLVPAKVYWDMYKDRPVRRPVRGEWVGEREPAQLARVRFGTDCDLQPEAERLQAIRAYYGMVTSIDHQIGILTGELRERGLTGNTVILFTADHGEMLFDHNAAHKCLFYRGSAHVPMIVHLPPSYYDRIAPGQVLAHPVMLQDVMPTLLELAGLDVPDSLDGESFVRLMEDPKAGWREYAFGDCNLETYGLTDNRFKYIYYVEGGLEQLFNTEADPDETRDLATDPAHAEQLALWRGRLVAELEKAGDPNVKDGELVATEPKPVDTARERARCQWNVRGMQWPSI